MYGVIRIYIFKYQSIVVNPSKKMGVKTSNGMFHQKEHQTLQENQRKYDNFLDILSLRCHPKRKQFMEKVIPQLKKNEGLGLFFIKGS